MLTANAKQPAEEPDLPALDEETLRIAEWSSTPLVPRT
jgi:hypothetical protein